MQHSGDVHGEEGGFPEPDAVVVTMLRGSAERLPDLLNIRWALAALAATLILAAAWLNASYWPGIMTWDPIEQYNQALHNRYADWHPPIMAWIWHWLIRIEPGTGPMFVLQLTLYLGGYGLLSAWALKRGQSLCALAFAACALMPIPMALMGSVLKDCLMTGAMLSAVALLIWGRESGSRLLPIGALALLLLATALRFNALPATAPLIVALLPVEWRRGRVRLVLTFCAVFVPLLAMPPLINRALHSERTGVEYSQFIFDLAGITEKSGIDVFPDIATDNVVAVNHRCYNPEMWDSYASWDDPPRCPINFDDVRQTFADNGQNPALFWLRAITAHPLAYAEHRWAHLKVNLRLNVPTVNFRPAYDRSIPNIWHYSFHPNRVQGWIDRAAILSDRSPLGWPICWLALAVGLLALSPDLPSRSLIVPISLSVVFYALSYAVVSVASDLRYHLWTMVGTCVAAILVAGDLASGGVRPSVKRLCIAGAPLILATIACLIDRMGLAA